MLVDTAIRSDRAAIDCLGTPRALILGQASILQVLIETGSVKRRVQGKKYTTTFGSGPLSMLHVAADFGDVLSVHVRLVFGEDESALDDDGNVPADMIRALNRSSYAFGLFGRDALLIRHNQREMTKERAVATERMLARGAAFRAMPWAWPSGASDVVSFVAFVAPSQVAATLGEKHLRGRSLRRRRRNGNNFMFRILGR